jgi:hypothetical protein
VSRFRAASFGLIRVVRPDRYAMLAGESALADGFIVDHDADQDIREIKI